MKILHIYKSAPDETTRTLKDLAAEGAVNTDFNLHEGDPDYEQLIEMIFDHDKVISWW